MAREYLDRPPRIQPELPIGEESLAEPPDGEQNGIEQLIQTMLPMLGMLSFIFGAGSGNPTMLLTMGLTMIVTVGLSLFMRARSKAKLAAQRAIYTRYLLEKRQELARLQNAQRLHLSHIHPSVATLLEIAMRSENSRFGSRLWERRPSDADFGALRIGIGTRPSSYIYKFDEVKDPNEEDSFKKDARRVADESMLLQDAPVSVPLRTLVKGADDDGPKPRHSVGVYGQNPTSVADFMRAVTAQLCAFHSPQDTRLFVLGHAKQEKTWQWAEWLPHVNVRSIGDDDDDTTKPRKPDQMLFTDDYPTMAAFWKRIKKELDQRTLRLKDSGEGKVDVTLPFFVVIVDISGDLPANSPLREIAQESAIAQIMTQGPMLGAAIMFMANEPTRVPSDCRAMIEIAPAGNQVVFRYSEVGFNTPRLLGQADLMTPEDGRQNFSARIRRLDLLRPFGADLPRAVDLMQMQSVVDGKRITSIDTFSMKEKWVRSLAPKAQDWLSAPIGMMSMKDVRTLIFSAKEGGDGVHGMIAGTTGSGKSEMLSTLILGLATKYDPRIINFVLVDYKGGAAFEPFRHLPHTVDILTNLQANAVERMFIALGAVMDKRSELLAKSGVTDLIKYRSEVAPKLAADDPRPKVFPHLFIIVDEFAEMVTANPEYKSKFESVTRLGRAFGVTLILATQRPAGVVSDQMRANMKFRICLRVETPDDSKELLGSSDAAFLPNIGGRGYVQSGNEVMQGVQVAWAGPPYSDDRTVNLKDVVWLDEESLPVSSGDVGEFAGTEIGEALGMKNGEVPRTLLDWVVGTANLRAKADGVPAQTKPWPEPLPEYLSLTDPVDAKYLNTERVLLPGKQLVINPLIHDWLNNEKDAGLWPEFDWKQWKPLIVDIGLIDNPYNAEQRLLTLDVSAEPIVVFGSSGRGKTTFVKSLLVALGALRSPDELYFYALDFGRGGLKNITPLPHVGASIDASETARVEQLIRMLRNFSNERQEQMAKSTANNIAEFNAQNPTNIFPEIVTVIDNFAEFKESYEHLIPDLMALIRDGRQFGIYFVISTGGSQDLGGKLMNLLTKRLTFSQPDPTVYADLIARGARPFDNVPGRGLVGVALGDTPIPLEFHVGVPGQPALHGDSAEIDGFQLIAQRMERVWLAMGKRRPAAELPRAINMLEMISLIEFGRPDRIKRVGDLPFVRNWAHSMKPESQEWIRGPLGLISSKDIRSMVFQAQADGVHGMIAGTTGSGKSELLQTMILGMAMRYDPRILNFVLVDFKGGSTIEPFKKLPHAVDLATDLQGNAVERIFIAIKAEMDRRAKILADSGVSELIAYRKEIIPKGRKDLPDSFPNLFVIVDEFAEMIAQNPEYKAQFESITRLGRAFGVSLILATQRPAGVVSDQMRANMKFRICLRVETPEDSKELLKRPDAARLPQIAGRGYIQAGLETLTEVQAAYSGINYTDDTPDPRYTTQEILEALDLSEEKKPGKLIYWLVGALGAEARRQKIPRQYKPWPDPLPMPPDPKDPDDPNWSRWPMPLNHPVDATYIKGSEAATLVLAPEIRDWLKACEIGFLDKPEHKVGKVGDAVALPDRTPLWTPYDWHAVMPLVARIGIIDNPFRAEQKVLALDVGGDPMVIFGASGKGKTSLLKSMVFSLCAQYTPAELNVYALDFGRGGLRSFRSLPHCGAVIDASQTDRVQQLFRMLRGVMNERQERLAKFADMADYNLQQKGNLETLFPSIVVVIDNFAEFKENFEPLLVDLMGLIRDGRQFGIYYAITATSTGDMTGKLLNLMGQKLTFTLADASAVVDIVGRGALSLANLPGRGLINIDGQPLEYHVGLPVMENEKDPFMRLAERMEKVWFAMGGKRPAAEVPKSITLLEMYSRIEARRVPTLGDLDIGSRWKRSMLTENQEWLSAPIGMVSSKEVRTLVFSAKPGGDGVHGMAAGTTGSGKSELLQTLISALAIKYDPRIVNFVLIDYKGGPTVEPFRKLPHSVDIATNLDGNAVDRIFVAIGAEMNRRSDVLAKAGVADLVDYRKKVIPTLRPGSPFPETFPHLFVVVDEFAEMVTNNPEYKDKFNSITRLGRSFGVTLILATQRPTGAVTDQMRANMKFRLCLRVETSDDSREMLGRGDGAQLPAIPGRGYIQVGGGPVVEFQSAYSGANYDEKQEDPQYTVEEMMAALDNPLDAPRTLLAWLVAALAAEARRQKIPKQFKPWPDGLPLKLGLNRLLDATYFPPKGVEKPPLLLSPAVKGWVDNTALAALEGNAPTNGHAPDPRSVLGDLWTPHDWSQPLPVVAQVGLIDNPYLAEQRVLAVDMAGDPMAVFGAAGRGKTTFLKSLIMTLAAQRRPDELHIYVLDFGRGGLKALRPLPHIAGIIETNEEERVERFFRVIRNTIDSRQQLLQAYDSLADYNAKNPASALPSIVVVIDNIVEFRETYERYAGDLIALVRDGRAFGINFIITATLMGDVPGKLYSLLTQRVTFTQSDPTIYTEIVGRGWQRFNDTPGRGLCTEMIGGDPVPLEFHTAIPLMEDDSDGFRELAARMSRAWAMLEVENPALRSRKPKVVEPLTGMVDLAALLPAPGEGDPMLVVPMGIDDMNREPFALEFRAKGPHLIVIGPPVTGKTSTVRALVMALANSYSPEQVAMVLLDGNDVSRSFFHLPTGTGAEETTNLASLPHVLGTASNAKEFEAVIARLQAEFDDEAIKRLQGVPGYDPQDNRKRMIFVIADHWDEAETMRNLSGNINLTMLGEVGKGKNIAFVVAGSTNLNRGGSDELRRRIEGSRYTLVLGDIETVRNLGVRLNVPYGAPQRELPPGRGWIVKSVRADVVQVASPAIPGKNGLNVEQQLIPMVEEIVARHATRARWSYHGDDIDTLKKAVLGQAVTTESTTAAPESTAPIPESNVASLLASLNLPKFEFKPVELPEPGDFAKVVVKDDTAAEPENGAAQEPEPAAKGKKK